ncbi:putative deoxyribonuclease tatdn2 [Branchiostoma belcheri]|nr:putative deoxyribonuclease tatdn2 [Branchiostoma belcheri]
MEAANKGRERGRNVGKRRGKEAGSRKGRGGATVGVLGGGRGKDAGRELSGPVGGSGGTDGDGVRGFSAIKQLGLPSMIADAVVSDDWEAELQEVPTPIRGKRAELQKDSPPISGKRLELQESLPPASEKLEAKQDKPHTESSHSVKPSRRKTKKSGKTEKTKSTPTSLPVHIDIDEQKKVKSHKVDQIKSTIVTKPLSEKVCLQAGSTDENRNTIHVQKAREASQTMFKKATFSPADSVLNRILSPKPKVKPFKIKMPSTQSKDAARKEVDAKKEIPDNWWSDKEEEMEDQDVSSSAEQTTEKEDVLGGTSPSQVLLKRKEEDRAQMPPPPLPDTPLSSQEKRKKPKRKATPMPPRFLSCKTHLEDELEGMTRSASAPSSRIPSREPSPSLLRRPSEDLHPPCPVSPPWEDYRRECLDDSCSETSSLEHNLSLASQEELEGGRYGDDEEEANSDPHSENRRQNGGNVDHGSGFPPKLLPAFRGNVTVPPAQVQGTMFPLRAPPGLHREQSSSLQVSPCNNRVQSAPEIAPLPPHLMQKAQELQRQSVQYSRLSQNYYNYALHLFHKSLMLNSEYLNIVGGNANSPPPPPLSPAQPGTYGPVFPYPPPPQVELSPQYPPPPPVALQGAAQPNVFFQESTSPFGPYNAPVEQHGSHWYSPHSPEPMQQQLPMEGRSATLGLAERSVFNLLPPGHFEVPPRMRKKSATADGGTSGKYVIPAYRPGTAMWKEPDTSDETSSSVTSPPYKRKMMVSWPSLREVSYVWQVGVKNAGYVDSHCHIDYLFDRMSFRESFQAFMSKANFPSSFEGCVAVFCDPKSWVADGFWKRLLEENDNVWGAFGCHPHSAKQYSMVTEVNLLNCLQHEKAIAFGEIGLDNSKDYSPPSVQRVVFIRQLRLAMQIKKPLVLHCRQADDEMMEIMRDLVPRDYIIHRHCFTESFAVAKMWMEAYPNMYLGITALVTFPTTRMLQDAVRRIPLDRLLLETDAPYFVPRQIPQGKVTCSHPAMAVCVAEKIAELKCIPLSEVLAQVRENTRAVYGI